MTIPLYQPVVCPILVGRSAELAALQACIQAPTRGQGSVVLLSGKRVLANRGWWPNCNDLPKLLGSNS